MADANHPVSPSRRLVFGTVLGAVAALLVTAGFGAAGLLSPASATNWKQGGQVILEEDSGGHFVLGQDGLLHPVINQASALLLAGTSKTVTVSASALRSAPRGATLGIPGAPDTVPSAGSLTTPTLVRCSRVNSDQPRSAVPASVVLLASSGGKTAALAGMSGLAGGRGLLVQPPKGDRYLVTGGTRYRLPDRAAVIALGYQDRTPLRVSSGWLNTLPAGRDLRLVAVPGAGTPGPSVGGTTTRVGQVLATSGTVGGTASYYLVRRTGLEPISQTEASLVLNDTKNAAAYQGTIPDVRRVAVADVAAVRTYPAGDDASGYPPRVPKLAGVGGKVVVCATGGTKNDATVATGSALPLPPGARTMPTGARQAAPVADRVYVPPGSGALVTAQVAPGAPAGTSYLVTDAGMKFPVADAAARKALGYGRVKPTAVPQSLLRLLPTGPALDPATAQDVITTGSDG